MIEDDAETTDLFDDEFLTVSHDHEHVFMTMRFVTIAIPIRNYKVFAEAVNRANERLEKQKRRWLRARK